jgi:hypothetical protein
MPKNDLTARADDFCSGHKAWSKRGEIHAECSRRCLAAFAASEVKVERERIAGQLREFRAVYFPTEAARTHLNFIIELLEGLGAELEANA